MSLSSQQQQLCYPHNHTTAQQQCGLCQAAKFATLVFKVLLLHGIKNEKSGFVKPFLIFHYTLYVLSIASVAVMSICCAVFYGRIFTIVLCGLLYIMILTFLFIFNIGFYVALHSIYVEMEKRQQQMKKNIEFINSMSFKKC